MRDTCSDFDNVFSKHFLRSLSVKMVLHHITPTDRANGPYYNIPKTELRLPGSSHFLVRNIWIGSLGTLNDMLEEAERLLGTCRSSTRKRRLHFVHPLKRTLASVTCGKSVVTQHTAVAILTRVSTLLLVDDCAVPDADASVG